MDMTDQHAPDEPTAAEIDNADFPETASPRDAEPAELAATVEAILFASDAPLPVSRIATVAEMTPGQIKTAVETLNEQYGRSASAFRIETIANGYQMLTLPEYHDVLKRLLNVKKETKLTQPALEALAIVAYRQPVLRADIEAVRGVACGEVLRGLMERGLVKIVGRADVIGRPMLYGTTRRFLEIFGLKDLKELPRIEELRELAASREKAPVATESALDDTETSNEDTEMPDNSEKPIDDRLDDETEEEFDEENEEESDDEGDDDEDFDEDEDEEDFDEEDDEDEDFDEDEDEENP